MAAGDLTTLAAVREFLQKDDTDTSQDALLSSLITRASVALSNQFAREWVPSNGETRTVPYVGRGYLDFVTRGWDLRTLTSVSYAGTPLAADRVQAQPVDQPEGVFWGVELADYLRDTSTSSTVAITVTGDWGFAEVPADVEHACIVTVKVWLREEAAITAEGGIARFERTGNIPMDVISGLSHYLRPQVF